MELIKTLKSSFLFSGLDEESLMSIIRDNPPNVVTVKRGDTVYSSAEEAKVGFVISGRCDVCLDKSDGSRALINTLLSGGTFGVLSVFSEGEFPTRIYAAINSEVAFFDEAKIRHFVNSNSQISTNLINFLANRISFLNRKIITFSGTRVTDRLSAYLICEAEKYSSNTFPFNCQKVSTEINAGRASVYRALDSLSEQGFISIDNKTVTIHNLNALERNKK